MLDSITLTRVPGATGTPDSWTIALVSGSKTASFTLSNVSTTPGLATALLKVLPNLDFALNTNTGIIINSAQL